MTSLDEALNALAPVDAWRPNWDDVVARTSTRRVRRRVVVLAVAVAVAVVVPLVALSDINDWWFFKYGAAPAPAHAPVVVKTGEWSGHRWQLVAYPPVRGGLCVSMNPVSEEGSSGAGMECADLPLTFLAGGPGPGMPANVVGPVVATAVKVRIVLRTGRSLTVPTFPGPQPLERWRFYATQVDPAAFPRSPRPPFPGAVVSVAGLDSAGRVVACLVPGHAKNGISPPSACR